MRQFTKTEATEENGVLFERFVSDDGKAEFIRATKADISVEADTHQLAIKLLEMNLKAQGRN